MPTYATTAPNVPKDGVPYATASTLPTAEADLYNISPVNSPGAPPVGLTFHQALVASVILTLTGATSPTYVVLQSDLGDGNWFDVAWITTNSANGTLVFSLSAGTAGAGAQQQTRASGTAPPTSGANQMPLGSRIRFVGQTGGSNTVTATITYKLLPLR